jgi:membrane-associated phospholipid phosphatase
MNFMVDRQSLLSTSAVFVPLIVIGYFFLDIRLAEIVSKTAGVDLLLSRHISNIPDILFGLVCLTTVVGWGGHFCLARKATKPSGPDIFMVLGSSVPLSFVFKDIIKHLFGRTNTRVWLVDPDQYGLHWFQGGGIFSSFPSGHMAVFTALMLGISHNFPRVRPACLGFLLCLGLALIATEHHFFSDVIAGTYLGMLVDLLTWRSLSFFYRIKNPITQ